MSSCVVDRGSIPVICHEERTRQQMEQTRNVKKAVRRMAKLWWRTVET
jgi:hypothetical protein